MSENDAKVSYNRVYQCVAWRIELDLAGFLGMGWYWYWYRLIGSRESSLSRDSRDLRLARGSIVRENLLALDLWVARHGQLPLFFARVGWEWGGAIPKLSKQLWGLFCQTIPAMLGTQSKKPGNHDQR